MGTLAAVLVLPSHLEGGFDRDVVRRMFSVRDRRQQRWRHLRVDEQKPLGLVEYRIDAELPAVGVRGDTDRHLVTVVHEGVHSLVVRLPAQQQHQLGVSTAAPRAGCSRFALNNPKAT